MTGQLRYLLKTSHICRLLDERNVNHGEFASGIGVSRNHWSILLNRKRHLTPRVRRALLEALGGAPDSLWDRVQANTDEVGATATPDAPSIVDAPAGERADVEPVSGRT